MSRRDLNLNKNKQSSIRWLDKIIRNNKFMIRKKTSTPFELRIRIVQENLKNIKNFARRQVNFIFKKTAKIN